MELITNIMSHHTPHPKNPKNKIPLALRTTLAAA